jgi:hypothetical protein
LACGRHISSDASSHGFMREIPQCWLTGQAAGAAAAIAANAGLQPRAVDVRQVQAALRKQGVFIRDTDANAEGEPNPTPVRSAQAQG